MNFLIRQAGLEQMPMLTQLMAELWLRHEADELETELAAQLQDARCFFALAYVQGEAVGFAQCQLRQDYVEGCSHSPAGYLEGIYVRPAFRRKGAAAQLLAACKRWAKQQGCAEFASDCELENSESAAFHAAMGFAEASRNIHFVQKL